MTVVGIVSDTHLPRFGTALPRALVDGLRAAAVTQILHLGDMTQALAVPLFEALAPFDAVAGNNDPDEIWTRYGRRKIVTIEDVRIGMVHGDEGRGRSTPENAIGAFADADVDVVLYGHSHQPKVFESGSRLIANPGSPTDRRMMPTFSYGIMTIDGRRAAIDLKFFHDRAV